MKLLTNSLLNYSQIDLKVKIRLSMVGVSRPTVLWISFCTLTLLYVDATRDKHPASNIISGVTMGWLLRLVRGPTGGMGPPTVLEFLVIDFSACLVLLSNCYYYYYYYYLFASRNAYKINKHINVVCRQ